MRQRSLLILGVAILGGLLGLGTLWWYSASNEEPVRKLPELHGQTLAIVLAQLGEPDTEVEYAMADSPGGEFRVELYNTYPLKDAKAAQARIKELQWHREQYSIAVWLHQVNGQWVVLDTCRWEKGIVF